MAILESADRNGVESDGLGPPSLPSPNDSWAAFARNYERALWAGSFADAETMAVDALRRGASLSFLYQNLMAPALHRVGDMWESGELGVADEHLATEATMRAMASLTRIAMRRRSAPGGRCVLFATVPGERHGVGMRMASDVLELHGHEVVHLGIDTPLEEITSLVASVRPDAVAVSCTMPTDEVALHRLAAAIWAPAGADTAILVGGRGAPDRLPAGEIARIDDLDCLVAAIGELPGRQGGEPPAAAANPFATPSTEPPADPRPPSTASEWSDALIAIDAGGRVIEWDEEATALLGHGREEVLGSELRDLVVPLDQRDDYERALLGSDASGVGRLRLMRRDRERIEVAMRAVAMAADSPLTVLLLSRRERTDSDLRLRALLDAAAEAMITVLPDGTVTGWNSAAAELYGCSAENAIGQSLVSLIAAPGLTQEPVRWLREVRAGKTVEAFDDSRIYADGGRRSLLVRVLPVRDADGEVVAASVVIGDATPSRRYQSGEGGEAEQRLWHSRIDHALGEDLFVLAAQPIIDLDDGSVDHCELLLRMKVGGRIVMPGDFIPIAERSGQIRAIDRWVAERGIELADHHPVAVNLSGASLSNHGLLGAIEAKLAETGVDPDRVTFEITETAAAEKLEDAVVMVEALREMGCRVALDDFGSGFGSFTYLSRLPVTELKIDNAFTRSARTGVAERRVIDAVVSVGRTFEIRTVAEGVEDSETLAMLRGAGVDLGQGYLFDRPQLIESDRWAVAANG